MRKRIDKAFEIVFYSLAFFVLAFLAAGMIRFPDERQQEMSEYSVLDTDWYRVMEDGSEVPVQVPCKCEAEWGEVVTIKGTLPENIGSDTARWLCFTSSLQDISVRIGGEMRKEYSTKKTRLWGKTSVSVYLFVPLCPDDGGRELTVSLSTMSDYTGVMHEVYRGTLFGIWGHFVRQNALSVIMALFMLILSVVSIIINTFITIRSGRRFFLAYLGSGVFLLSVWVLAQSPMRQLYFENVSLAGSLTHMIMYLFVIPIVMYLDYIQGRRYSVLYRSYLAFALIFCGVAAALEISGIVDFAVLQPMISTVQIISSVMIVGTFICDFRKGLIKDYRLIAYGFIGLIVCGILQLAFYFDRTAVFNGSFLCIGLVFLLMMAVISAIRDYMHMESNIAEMQRKNRNLTYQLMETLVHTIEAKDEYTKGHSTRVAEYSRLLAEKMGMSEEECSSLYFMASLHDIGKIGIADSIINKPGKLTEEEYSVIKTHPEVGFNILRNMSEIKDIEYGARWHHERYDGKGYPDGLSGEEIPVYARIIAVADVYDAMTSNRSYRKVLPQEEVKKEIERVKGTQLDPEIAGYMIELIDSDKEYRLRQ